MLDQTRKNKIFGVTGYLPISILDSNFLQNLRVVG